MFDSTASSPGDGVNTLRAVVARLRAPDGCPWDREQTHASLLPGLLEECHELIDAVRDNDEENLREELGDLLLQTVMHCQMAAETGRFDLDAVAAETAEKLVRRHPHVFGEHKLPDSDAVLRQWDAIKAREKPARTSALDGVPRSLPALALAQKTSKKAAKIGFDWAAAKDVLAKISEELDETRAALESGDGLAEEIGDLLFATVNLARMTGIDAELALREATHKFSRRFRRMETVLRERALSWESLDPAAMDALWEEAKRTLTPPAVSPGG